MSRLRNQPQQLSIIKGWGADRVLVAANVAAAGLRHSRASKTQSPLRRSDKKVAGRWKARSAWNHRTARPHTDEPRQGRPETRETWTGVGNRVWRRRFWRPAGAHSGWAAVPVVPVARRPSPTGYRRVVPPGPGCGAARSLTCVQCVCSPLIQVDRAVPPSHAPSRLKSGKEGLFRKSLER